MNIKNYRAINFDPFFTRSPTPSNHTVSPRDFSRQYPTPPSTFATVSSSRSNSAKKSKILCEIEDFGSRAPILNAKFKANGNCEFITNRDFFIDDMKKKEIRVRNGATIIYKKVKICIWCRANVSFLEQNFF